jgi:hypothetical protein
MRRELTNEFNASSCGPPADSGGFACATVPICHSAPNVQQPRATDDGFVPRWLVDFLGW